MRQTVLRNTLSLLVCVLAGCSTPAIHAADSKSLESRAGAHLFGRNAEELVAESSPTRPFDFHEITLDNGLRVITMEDFSSPIVAVEVWYHVGSKDEHPSRQGFAHMFEHMMFRGTEVLGPEDHFNLIHRVGGTNNAYTYFDYTAYVNSVPANQLDLVLWLEAERMMFLNISQDGFETERNVVEEERRENYLNVPYGTLPEQIISAICRQHPYRWLPIGKIAHLEAAKLDELRHFWDIHYVPGNATLVIVGAIPHEDAQNAARTYFGWMPRLPDPPKVTVREPEQTEERTITLKERLGPIPAAGYAYRAVARNHPDSIPLEMTLNILANGESSRLYSALVKERKLCAVLLSQEFFLEQDGLIGVVGALHPIKYILGKLNPFSGPHTPILKAFDKHIETLQRDGVTDHELEKAKNQMLKSAVAGRLAVRGKAETLGETCMLYDSPDWLNHQLDTIASVTRDDIQRVARTYLVPQRRTTVKVVPKKRYKYDPNAGLDIDEYVPPERQLSKKTVTRPESFPSTPPIRDMPEELPEVPAEERVLANGLKIVVVPNEEVPLVVAAVGLKHGAWAENPKRPGVASITLEMLTKGTEDHSAEELADIIEFNALSLNGRAGMDASLVQASALSGKLATAIELLAEVVQRPTFPKDELKLLKSRRKVELSYWEKDPGYQASCELQRQVFGDHPYARTPEGRRKNVRAIKRGHLVEWWDTFARPDAAILYVAGDITADKVFALAERHFGDWAAAGPMPVVDVPTLPEREDTRIYLVNNPRAEQSEIRVGQTSIEIGHPAYHKTRVFSQIFGGSFGSRLNKAIRIERGLTYGAGGGVTARRLAGSFSSSTSTKTEATADAVQAVLDVIEEMRDTPPTSEELTSAKSYLAGRVPSKYETPPDMVNALWFIEYNGLPRDDLQRSLAEYKATEIGEIVRIANEHIDPGKLVIVVVGDAKKIRKSLEAIAPVSIVK